MSCAEQCVTNCDKVCSTCAKFRADASGSLARPVRRANGTVIYTGRVARTGVHKYPWGTARRDTAELAHLVSQMPGIPVTITHPRGMFATGTSPQVGRVDTAWLEKGGDVDFAVAQIIVEDMSADNRIRSGNRELSLGYRTDIIKGWDRNGRVDHLAFVGAARCGAECAIRLDSEAARLGGGSNAFIVQSMLRNKKNG